VDRVTRHYEDLLAAHYTWMSGLPLTEKVAEQKALLKNLGISPKASGVAIDLGSGPGFQSLALAELGYERVLAIDTSQALLDELAAAKGDRPIEIIGADLRAFADFISSGTVNSIVCMGDTLTHLESRSDVSKLFLDAFEALAPGGRLVLTFRDLSTELTGLDRFLPVRADADRIMLCVLDYGPETVTVSDLIHIRNGDQWTLHKSSYQKLRIAPASVARELADYGFIIERDEPIGRMHAISARKPIVAKEA